MINEVKEKKVNSKLCGSYHSTLVNGGCF